MSNDIEIEQNKMIEKITEELKKLDKYLDESDERIFGEKIEKKPRENLRIDPQNVYMQDILPIITFRMSNKVINDLVRNDNLYFLPTMKKFIYNAAKRKQKDGELRQYFRKNKMHSMRPYSEVELGDICNRKECDNLTKLINEAKSMEIINEDDINDVCVNMMNKMFKEQCRRRRTSVSIAFENPIAMQYYKQQNNINATWLIQAGSDKYDWEFKRLAPMMSEEEEDKVFFNGDWDDYDYLFAIQKIGMKQIGIEIDEQEVKKKFLEKRELYKAEKIGKEDAIELELRISTDIDMMIEILRTYRMIGKTAVCRFNEKEFFSCDNLDIDNIYKLIYGKDKKEINELLEKGQKKDLSKYFSGRISMENVVKNAVKNEGVLEEVKNICECDNAKGENKNKKGETRGEN